MLPRYCNDIAVQYGINISGVNKLVQNLNNESNTVFTILSAPGLINI